MRCQAKKCHEEAPHSLLCEAHLKRFVDLLIDRNTLMSDRTETILRLHGDCGGCGKEHNDQDCPLIDFTGVPCTDNNCTDHDE